MKNIFSQFLRHLVRKHILLWSITLALILTFSAALGALCWCVRMQITWRVTVTTEPEKRLTRITIPARSFLSIREGDTVTLSSDETGRREGVIHSVTESDNRLELVIAFMGEPVEAGEGTVTLRGERLLGAFFKN